MKALTLLKNKLENNLSFYAGYPQNTQFDYSALDEFLKYPMNNVGDPFDLTSSFGCQEFEIQAIEWFLKLYGSNINNGWGYVTTGGTEGILFGLWHAREYLKNPIAYFLLTRIMPFKKR